MKSESSLNTPRGQSTVLDFIIKAGRAVLRRLGISWSAAILYERDIIQGQLPDVSAKTPVEIVWGTTEHINLVRGLFPEQQLELFEKRLAEGKFWLLFLIEGKVAYSAWLTFQDEFEPNLGIWVRLTPGEAYFFHAYTIPEFRGLGLHGLGMKQCMVFAAERGAGKMSQIIFVNNTVARHVAKKLRFHKKKLIRKMSIFRWSNLTTINLVRKSYDL